MLDGEPTMFDGLFELSPHSIPLWQGCHSLPSISFHIRFNIGSILLFFECLLLCASLVGCVSVATTLLPTREYQENNGK